LNWIPKWIGKIYCKLWAAYEEKLFNFEETQNICRKYTRNYLSELRKAQALFVFEKMGRKKKYRLIPPNLYTYSIAHNIDMGWLKQGAYANLLLKVFMLLKEEFDLEMLSLGVYGSVARNQAKNESDLDLFLVFKEIEGTTGERIDLLSKIEHTELIKNEIEFLHQNTYFPRLSFYPRKVTELRMSFFTIDLAFDLKIIYDMNIISKFLDTIKKKIEEKGITRKYLDEERYYLDLNLTMGEIFEFE